jgi:hypothetical protein
VPLSRLPTSSRLSAALLFPWWHQKWFTGRHSNFQWSEKVQGEGSTTTSIHW